MEHEQNREPVDDPDDLKITTARQEEKDQFQETIRRMVHQLIEVFVALGMSREESVDSLREAIAACADTNQRQEG